MSISKKELTIKLAVLYVYLGQKGGGAEFDRIMREYVENHSIHDAIFLESQRVSQEFHHQFNKNISVITPRRLVEIPRSCLSIALGLFRLFFIRRHFESVVILMASPWDYPFFKLAKLMRKRLVVLIHDLQPHPGELWPRKKSIQKRIALSNNLVFLGKSTSDEFKSLQLGSKKNYIVINHPVFFYKQRLSDPKQDFSEEFQILFVGRIKEYKGLEVLSKALFQMENQQITTLIAGEGKIQIDFPSNVRIINKWLHSDEIVKLISEAKIVVFPYTEASQSGLIPICMAMEKQLVISDVKGLKSQTEGYGNLSIFKSGDSSDLAKILESSITTLGKKSKNFESTHENLISEVEFAETLHNYVSKIG